MSRSNRTLTAIACLLLSSYAGGQAGGDAYKIVLPNPQLINCRSAKCSQLWKQEPKNDNAIYPSQVLTDIVNGEIVGLTAVYDKSVSEKDLAAAISTRYGKSSFVGVSLWGWRVVPDQFAIQLSKAQDGAKQRTYLKFVPYGSIGSLVPSAHIDHGNSKK